MTQFNVYIWKSFLSQERNIGKHITGMFVCNTMTSWMRTMRKCSDDASVWEEYMILAY